MLTVILRGVEIGRLATRWHEGEAWQYDYHPRGTPMAERRTVHGRVDVVDDRQRLILGPRTTSEDVQAMAWMVAFLPGPNFKEALGKQTVVPSPKAPKPPPDPRKQKRPPR